MKISVEFATS